MSVIITEMLGTDSFSGSRIIINANFTALKNFTDDLETNFGLSLLSGNIDVSSATGGSIKAKTMAMNSVALPSSGTPTITLTGSTGAMVGTTLSLATSITVPTANITNLTCSNLGSSIFNGEATFNELVKFNDGIAENKTDVGAVSTHTVLNSDRVIIFEPASASPPVLVLDADAALVDGHVVTLIDKSNNTTTISTTNIMGFSTGSITFSGEAYKSSITLMYSLSDDKWIIVSSSNMTIT